MNINDIRAMFPALTRKVYGRNLVYFDNAATSHRVQTVLDEWNRISAESNANIHRAVHRLADEATQAYEQARDAVKDFINAECREEIVFTSGTTAAINLVAFCYGEAFVGEGDEVALLHSLPDFFMGSPTHFQQVKAYLNAVGNGHIHISANTIEGGQGKVLLLPQKTWITQRLAFVNNLLHTVSSFYFGLQ